MGKDEKKKAPPKVSDKEAAQIIWNYMDKQNRPYNAITLFENLHGAVSKTQATKLLGDLTEKGKLTCKEFGKQKVYWKVQGSGDSEELDPENLANLDKEIVELESQKEEMNVACKGLSTDISRLNAYPPNQELDEANSKLSNENKELQDKITNITENREEISPQEKKKIEKEYESMKQSWKKRKRMCRDICGNLEEATGKRFKELKEDIGLEVDEDYGVAPDDDRTTKLKKGE